MSWKGQLRSADGKKDMNRDLNMSAEIPLILHLEKPHSGSSKCSTLGKPIECSVETRNVYVLHLTL